MANAQVCRVKKVQVDRLTDKKQCKIYCGPLDSVPLQSRHLQIPPVSKWFKDCPLTKGEWLGQMDVKVKKKKKSVQTTWICGVAGLHALCGKPVRVKGANGSLPHPASHKKSNPVLTVICWEVSSIHKFSSDNKPLPELRKQKKTLKEKHAVPALCLCVAAWWICDQCGLAVQLYSALTGFWHTYTVCTPVSNQQIWTPNSLSHVDIEWFPNNF